VHLPAQPTPTTDTAYAEAVARLTADAEGAGFGPSAMIEALEEQAAAMREALRDRPYPRPRPMGRSSIAEFR
jgi:hypothetical protein